MRNINRVGEINYNLNGDKMIITEYHNALDIDVLFPRYNYVAKNKRYSTFKSGEIKNLYQRSVFNIGYSGEGKYNDAKYLYIRRRWLDIFNRCYSKARHIKFNTYKDCTVCKEWHNFQNFAKWYEDNYYEIEGEKMHLDKDILFKGNKIYSPQTCIFVPETINTLFIKSDASRGNLPIGVTFHKRDNKYYSRCNSFGKLIHLGTFNSAEDAFKQYKKYKENHILELANLYKDKIPDKLYDAMVNYKVEITD